MVRLRLTRLGAKKRPFYRVVAADSRSPRDGRFIEQLGYYDPLKDPTNIKLDLERIDYWLDVGAKPSETVSGLIDTYRGLTPEERAEREAPGRKSRSAELTPPDLGGQTAPAAAAEAASAVEAEAAPAEEAEAAPAEESEEPQVEPTEEEEAQAEAAESGDEAEASSDDEGEAEESAETKEA